MSQKIPAYKEDMNILFATAKKVQEAALEFDPLEFTKDIMVNSSEYNSKNYQEIIYLNISVVLTKLIVDIGENIFDSILDNYATILLVNLIEELETIADKRNKEKNGL